MTEQQYESFAAAGLREMALSRPDADQQADAMADAENRLDHVFKRAVVNQGDGGLGNAEFVANPCGRRGYYVDVTLQFRLDDVESSAVGLAVTLRALADAIERTAKR